MKIRERVHVRHYAALHCNVLHYTALHLLVCLQHGIYSRGVVCQHLLLHVQHVYSRRYLELPCSYHLQESGLACDVIQTREKEGWGV